MQYPFHPLADLFPLVDGHEFDELVASIRDHGLRDAITLCDGSILDGRNRYRACQEAGIEPRFEQFTGTDIHAFVADKNLHRRHLKEGQRALIAAGMATMKRGENNKYNNAPSEGEISPSVPPPTIDRAAELMNVNRSSVINAKKVLNEGTPEEIAAVRDGKAAASTIAKQIAANIPPEERHLGGRNSPAVQASNVRKMEKIRMKAHVWGQLRDGLTAIANLPRPADVVPIARQHDRIGLVDAKMFQSLQWMKEFAHEWSKRNQAASNGNADDADDHLDAGTGDRTA